MKEPNPHECFFDANDIEDFDYKNVELLKKFLSTNLKIRPKKRTGLCSKHQRQVAKSIKKARQAGLIPYGTQQ